MLPGNVQAFIDTPIYARTNGYLKRWYVDIGARVKAGQLLAEIETPEVDDQLQQARADLATARGQLRARRRRPPTRWQELLKTGRGVASRTPTRPAATMQAQQGGAGRPRASTSRAWRSCSRSSRSTRRSSGVITARNTDVGALIDAGSAGGPGKELFHIAATGPPARLRQRAAGLLARCCARASRPS